MKNSFRYVLLQLNKSIRLHELKLEGRINSPDCPLCQTFYECAECPVRLLASQDGCDGTPYFRTLEALDFCGADSKEYRKEEGAEIAFLKWVRYNLVNNHIPGYINPEVYDENRS